MWKCPEPPVLLRVKRFAINQEGLAGTGQERERDQEAFTLAMSSLPEKRLTARQDSFTSRWFEVKASIGQVKMFL